MNNKMTETARRIANSVNRMYAKTPDTLHDEVDELRDECGNALGLAGMCNSSEFNEIARQIHPAAFYPEI